MKWATNHGVKFLAQSGGHGTTTTWKIGEGDIVINLRALRNVTVNLEKGQATIGAGALSAEVLDEAYKNKAHIGPLRAASTKPQSPSTIEVFKLTPRDDKCWAAATAWARLVFFSVEE